MKKLFMVLCVVIMFFGIVGCPSDDLAPQGFTSSAVTKPNVGGGTSDGGAFLRSPSLLHFYCLALVWLVLQDLDANGLRNSWT